MLKVKNKLVGKISPKNILKGKLNNAKEYVYPSLIDLEITPSVQEQVFNHPNSYGYDNVTVIAVKLQDKQVIPTKEEQVITADSGYNGLNQISVSAVTNEVDSNIIAENIRSGVDILGVTGNFIGGKYAPRYMSFSNYNGTELDEEIANLDISNMTSMYDMFYYCSKLTKLDLSGFDTTNITVMQQAFYNCYGLSELNLSNFNTSNVGHMGGMFYGCSKLTSLNLSNFNTSSVTTMSGMFDSCSGLTTLDLSAFDTSNVTTMSKMFRNCSGLTTLNLSNFNTSKVTDMSNMFYRNLLLENIPELDASSCTSIASMFYNCTNLTTFGGLKNLGQAYRTNMSANNSYYKLDLSSCTNLTHDSLINVINNLYDIATKGCKTQALVLGTTNLAKLTEEEIAIATNKGWTVS